MRIAIINRDKCERKEIIRILQGVKKNMIFNEFSTAESLMQETQNYDIVLSEIDLDGMNGILFARFNRLRFRCIIFISNHVEYMEDAFYPNVFGFVLKKNIHKDLSDRFLYVLNNLKLKQVYTFSSSTGKINIEGERILYFYLDNGIIYLITFNRKFQLNLNSMKKIECIIDTNFFRANKTHIINLLMISKINFQTKSVIMVDNHNVEFSSRKWNLFKGTLNNLKEYIF